jgi:pantetheine-phosphate adenylyltransferase
MTTTPAGTHVAIYPGSFDPMTFGHLDVIRRGRRLFDRLIVAVGRHPGKDPLFALEERVEMARALTAEVVREEPRGAPVEVEGFSGLTVDFARGVARRIGAPGPAGAGGGGGGGSGGSGGVVLLRGIRNLSDLQNEIQQALTNRQVAGLETAFVVAGQDFAYTSSSLIKQVAALGEDGAARAALGTMVPAMVIERLMAKREARHPALERLRAAAEE